MNSLLGSRVQYLSTRKGMTSFQLQIMRFWSERLYLALFRARPLDSPLAEAWQSGRSHFKATGGRLVGKVEYVEYLVNKNIGHFKCQYSTTCCPACLPACLPACPPSH